MCPAGFFGSEFGATTSNCSGQCDAGYFCPPGSISPKQKKCGSIMGLTEDGNTFPETSSKEMTQCLLHQLPAWPIQFVEFSLLNEAEAEQYNPTKWDISSQTKGVANRLTLWDTSRKAWLSHGDGIHAMESGWRPGAKGKTSCMWKMFSTEDVYGLDGIGRVAGGSAAFLYGTRNSFRDRLFVASGSKEGSYSSSSNAVLVNRNDWIFYCVTSTGAFGHSEAYVATPADDGKQLNAVWKQENNLADGISANHRGMTYGRSSKAYYGGFYHWERHLNHTALESIYKLLSRFYPGKYRA